MRNGVLECPEESASPIIGPKSSHRSFIAEESPLIANADCPSISESIRERVLGGISSGTVLEHSVIIQATITHGHLGDQAVVDEIRRLYSKDVPARSKPYSGLRVNASEFDGTFAKPQY